jgi:L-alanine-DL-glutamate epimerase-like enolase superfamily enzyme
VPVHSLLGGKRQDQIKLFEVIFRTDPDVMADRVAEYRELGFRQFQMKVGDNRATDVDRFHKVAAAM